MPSNFNRRRFLRGASMVGSGLVLAATRPAWSKAPQSTAVRVPGPGSSAPMMGMGAMGPTEPAMADCIAACQACEVLCLSMATGYCLEKGGAHARPEHLKLMFDCAQICTVAVDFMARGSAYVQRICRDCAEICRACAASCQGLEGMENCVQACLRCAAACEKMAA